MFVFNEKIKVFQIYDWSQISRLFRNNKYRRNEHTFVHSNFSYSAFQQQSMNFITYTLLFLLRKRKRFGYEFQFWICNKINFITRYGL